MRVFSTYEGFRLHPLKNDAYPTITRQEQVPDVPSVCFRYMELRNKNLNPNSPAMNTPAKSPAAKASKGPRKYGDDAEFEGPNIMWGTISASSKANLKEVCNDI